MKNEVMRKIFDKISEYNRIIITRHIRPDGDAVGSSKGLQRMLKLTYPDKEIYLINRDYSDYVAFLGPENDEISDELYGDSLVIVTDTATADRISNDKYSLGKEIIKIDHHIDLKPYGDISWVEEESSSACELIVKFYDAFRDKLKLDREAATYLYTGMVTDSGRFRISATTGDTLRYAGILLDFGIDTETLFANLYLNDYDYLKFRSYIFKKMKMTENGVAYICVTNAIQKRFALSSEEASNTVSMLDSIKNSLIWIAFIEYGDGTTRVRLRSRFVTVNRLAEKYHGGGHDRASGATVYSKKEMKALINDADELIREYKESHEGWM